MGRPRSDIAERVVHAARARFLVEGVDGASLRAIAHDAGTSVGMVYYYFPTKDDLFLAVVEEVYGALLDDLEALLTPPASLEERLVRLFVRIGAASEHEAEVVRLVVREALVSSSRLDRLVERFQRGHLPLLLGAVAGGVEEGAVDPRLPLPLAMILTAAMGVVPQVLRRAMVPRLPFPGLPEGEALARVLVDRLLHGIAPRTPTIVPDAAPVARRPAKKRATRRR